MRDRRMQLILQPGVLTWARERAGFSVDALAEKLQVKRERVQEWEHSGEISVAQASRLSHATHTPEGFLYLSEPPEDRLPITDFRTVGDKPLLRPSPDLLETVYQMQRRQEWLRGELLADETPPLAFVGAFPVDTGPEAVATAMRETLGLEREWAGGEPGWDAALRFLRDRTEAAGVLVVINGVVGNNTSRKLNPEEFRGFALVDEYAPLIFINNADYKAAQMFTLAHELAHIFVGADGVSNFEDLQPTAHETERFCNGVAAEFLVPGDILHDYWNSLSGNGRRHQAVARRFKVSVIVAARRALDLNLIDRPSFSTFYNQYLSEERRNKEAGNDGGNFWNTQSGRIGRRFGAAVVRAVKEERLSYREAYALTGLQGSTFDKLADRMGVTL